MNDDILKLLILTGVGYIAYTYLKSSAIPASTLIPLPTTPAIQITAPPSQVGVSPYAQLLPPGTQVNYANGQSTIVGTSMNDPMAACKTTSDPSILSWCKWMQTRQ